VRPAFAFFFRLYFGREIREKSRLVSLQLFSKVSTSSVIGGFSPAPLN
jgi:hypothetical protein